MIFGVGLLNAKNLEFSDWYIWCQCFISMNLGRGWKLKILKS